MEEEDGEEEAISLLGLKWKGEHSRLTVATFISRSERSANSLPSSIQIYTATNLALFCNYLHSHCQRLERKKKTN